MTAKGDEGIGAFLSWDRVQHLDQNFSEQPPPPRGGVRACSQKGCWLDQPALTPPNPSDPLSFQTPHFKGGWIRGGWIRGGGLGVRKHCWTPGGGPMAKTLIRSSKRSISQNGAHSPIGRREHIKQTERCILCKQTV